ADGESLLKRALKIFENKLSKDDPYKAGVLHMLALAEAARGRWPAAALASGQSRRGTRGYAVRLLPTLSPTEQLGFLRTQLPEQHYSAVSLGLVGRQEHVPMVAASAEWLVNGKALTHEALAQANLVDRDVRAQPGLAEVFQELVAVRRQLATLAVARPD